MLTRVRIDRPAGKVALVRQAEKVTHLIDGEAEIARSADELRRQRELFNTKNAYDIAPAISRHQDGAGGEYSRTGTMDKVFLLAAMSSGWKPYRQGALSAQLNLRHRSMFAFLNLEQRMPCRASIYGPSGQGSPGLACPLQ